ncbi:hypothetical protein J6524_35970 [Bradyrhizobium sp. WSM 1738]|uniref:hypothetical protein n=1 Tax=Bradyrhizobium hereditatis TaxID=2821405 RepID=UPI001CE24722|nr:hypothetical protein [Bradyrhizobium hereditatis]MCA6120192.1 hypothetical protein [Bradyrhizobium hereditatis]
MFACPTLQSGTAQPEAARPDAELDEPGAMRALIELNLSANAQFQDPPGACKLIETAVSPGDQGMAERLAACRKN